MEQEAWHLAAKEMYRRDVTMSIEWYDSIYIELGVVCPL